MKTGKNLSCYVTETCLGLAVLMGAATVPRALAADEQMRLRERKANESRKPLTYAAEPGWTASFAGYVLGQVYPPTPKVGETRGVLFRERGFQKKLDAPFHGMDVLSLSLTPTSYRLFRLSASGYFTGDRKSLLAEGRALLKDIGDNLGISLAPFKFEAPDGSYWPTCNMSGPSGPIPKKYPVDESQWTTSRYVFAFSYTMKGAVRIDVDLGCIDDKWSYVCMSISDGEGEQTAKAEFDKSLKHDEPGVSNLVSRLYGFTGETNTCRRILSGEARISATNYLEEISHNK